MPSAPDRRGLSDVSSEPPSGGSRTMRPRLTRSSEGKKRSHSVYPSGIGSRRVPSSDWRTQPRAALVSGLCWVYSRNAHVVHSHSRVVVFCSANQNAPLDGPSYRGEGPLPPARSICLPGEAERSDRQSSELASGGP